MRWALLVAGCFLVLGASLWFSLSEPAPVRVELPTSLRPMVVAPVPVVPRVVAQAPAPVPVAPPAEQLPVVVAAGTSLGQVPEAAPPLPMPPPVPSPPIGGGAPVEIAEEAPADVQDDEPAVAARAVRFNPKVMNRALRQRLGAEPPELQGLDVLNKRSLELRKP